MISDNQMDQFFKDRLEKYSSSIPENMWARIMAKKKRDRMLWLFFSRTVIIALLVFGLTGSYLIFNQKKISDKPSKPDIRNNQPLASANESRANQPILSSAQDQIVVPEINSGGINAMRKSNTRINYFDAADHSKTNSSHHDLLSQTDSGSLDIATRKQAAVTDTSVVTNVKVKDSLDKKSPAKTTGPDSSQSKEVKKPEKKSEQNNTKWYLDLFASPDYPIVAPSPFDQSYSKLSYTIGFKINRAIGKHFSVKTGIQYSQINIVGDDSLFGGATIHLKRLDLPVLVGYSFGGANIRTTINGGAIFNVYSSVSSVPSQNLFTPPPVQDYFEKNLGVSLYLGVNFEKRIKEKLSLFVEPYYRYQLSSMTISSVQNIKFIDIVGISFGARYYFKK
jgi:hypothetical protein